MDIEYEAKFAKINKTKIRKKLKSLKAKLVRPEFLQRRFTFHLPGGCEIPGGWIRVRDEGDKITLTLKTICGQKISGQKEITLKVDDFEKARQLLRNIGCVEKSYQENKRELWLLDGIEITLDEWPFLEPFIEIEGKSEREVRTLSQKLGFNWNQAVFGSVHLLNSSKYGILEEVLNEKIPRIVFGEKNPYIIWLEKNKLCPKK